MSSPRRGGYNEQKTQKIDETVFLGINEQSTNDEDESITSIEYMKTHGGVKGVTTVTSTPIQIPSDQLKHTVFYETLSLTTEKQEDGMVALSYYDTSGKTISVTVALRNSEKELFSGTFFASEFETFVADASDTPHFIDMIVEHEEHGTITSTVFNPAGNTDTTINGVFTE